MTNKKEANKPCNRLNNAFSEWRDKGYILMSDEYWMVYFLSIQYVQIYENPTIFERFSDEFKNTLIAQLKKIANTTMNINSFASYINKIARIKKYNIFKNDHEIREALRNAKKIKPNTLKNDSQKDPLQPDNISTFDSHDDDIQSDTKDVTSEYEHLSDTTFDSNDDDIQSDITDETSEYEYLSDSTNLLYEEEIYNSIDQNIVASANVEKDSADGLVPNLDEMSLTDIYKKNAYLTERDQIRVLKIAEIEQSIESTKGSSSKSNNANSIFIHYLKLKYIAIKHNLLIGIQINLKELFKIGYLTEEDLLAFSNKESATIYAILAQKYQTSLSTISRVIAAKKKYIDAPIFYTHKRVK